MSHRFQLRVATIVLFLLQFFSQQSKAQQISVYGCATKTTSSFDPGKAVTRTGIKKLDLAMLQELRALDQLFRVNVGVYFFDDPPVLNAFFTPERYPRLLRLDRVSPFANITGSVFVSGPLLIHEYEETNGTLMSIPAIMAHEFAHAMQYTNAFPYEGKWRELHADYMAGWYIALRRIYKEQNVKQALLNFYKKGDYEINDPDHHGTPQERLTSFVAGFQFYDANPRFSSAAKAYNSGLNYLKMIAPAVY